MPSMETPDKMIAQDNSIGNQAPRHVRTSALGLWASLVPATMIGLAACGSAETPPGIVGGTPIGTLGTEKPRTDSRTPAPQPSSTAPRPTPVETTPTSLPSLPHETPSSNSATTKARPSESKTSKPTGAEALKITGFEIPPVPEDFTAFVDASPRQQSKLFAVPAAIYKTPQEALEALMRREMYVLNSLMNVQGPNDWANGFRENFPGLFERYAKAVRGAESLEDFTAVWGNTYYDAIYKTSYQIANLAFAAQMNPANPRYVWGQSFYDFSCSTSKSDLVCWYSTAPITNGSDIEFSPGLEDVVQSGVDSGIRHFIGASIHEDGNWYIDPVTNHASFPDQFAK